MGRALLAGSALALVAFAAAAPAGAFASQGHAGGAELVETRLPRRDLFPGSITEGPDGNMWFAVTRADPGHTLGDSQHVEPMIARMTPAGELTEFPLPEGLPVRSLVSGPGGEIWFLCGHGIGHSTLTGQVSLLPMAVGEESQMVVGPDGNLWFTRRDETSFDAIVRVTPAGQIAEFPFPRGTGIHDIAVGPDGDLWFTEVFHKQVGKITPAGQITEFPVAGSPAGIVSGPDGDLWVGLSPDELVRMSPTGDLLGSFKGTGGTELMVDGPDGRIWLGSRSALLERLAPDGRVSRTPLHSVRRSLSGLAEGPGDSVWFTAFGEAPCEGGGGTCMAKTYHEPGVLGHVVPGPLSLSFLRSGSAVHRRGSTLKVSCRGGDAAAVCHGSVSIAVRGRVLASSRINLKTDEMRSVVLSYGRLGGRRFAPAPGGSAIVTVATAGGRPTRHRVRVY